jgi:hypothetical protein
MTNHILQDLLIIATGTALIFIFGIVHTMITEKKIK